MAAPSSNVIRIKPAASAGASRSRTRFNKLVRQLEKERALLASWQEALPRLRSQAAQELGPLEQTYEQLRRRLLLLLDQAHDSKLMGKRDKAKLQDLICTVAEALLSNAEDAEVDAIYRKYVDDDLFGFATDEDEAMFRQMLEGALGMPLDDEIDISSPQAMLASMQARIAEQAEDEAELGKRQTSRKQPKSDKAAEREARQQAEQKRLQQSVRDIYRKLASALHPDRETDEVARDRKTALMQRVNAAYAANDLLGLLELQLEVEQLDQHGLDNLPDDRIKQYNKILDGQIKELQGENDELAFMLSVDLDLDPYVRPTPAIIEQALRDEVAELQAAIDELTRNLADFHDLKKLKAWLKTYRIPKDEPAFDDWY